MALTRKMLKAMDLEEEQITQIINAHSETVNALKEERDEYKKDAEKLTDVQKKLDDANEAIKKSKEDDFEKKYNDLKSEYDTYKNEQTTKAEKDAKVTAYKQLLKDAGVSEKRIDAIIKVTDMSDVKIGKDGKIQESEKLSETIKAEWSDFIISGGKKGANTPKPPNGNGGCLLTKEQIYECDEHGRYKLSTEERQKALVALEQSK